MVLLLFDADRAEALQFAVVIAKRLEALAALSFAATPAAYNRKEQLHWARRIRVLRRVQQEPFWEDLSAEVQRLVRDALDVDMAPPLVRDASLAR